MKNIEFKAKVPLDLFNKALTVVEEYNYIDAFVGTDKQQDIYFNVPDGKLKLRRGNIEKALVAYKRPETADSKKSSYNVLSFQDDGSVLLDILTTALGIKTIVNKTRKIFLITFPFCDNDVKIHFDRVDGLDGYFIEVEIRGSDSSSEEQLQLSCNEWQEKLGITSDMMMSHSYCELINETA